jgi:acyl-CoA thioesterase
VSARAPRQAPQVAPATLASGSRIPFLRTLGVSLREIGDRHAVVQVRVDARHANYFGGVHGGLIATLVDTVSFFPRPLLPSGRAVTTTNLQVTYVRAPTIGETLTARAELLHAGRRTASVVTRVEDAAGRLVAHGAVTLLVLDDAGATKGGGGAKAPRQRRARARRKSGAGA